MIDEAERDWAKATEPLAQAAEPLPPTEVSTYDGRGKSPDQIEGDITETRAQLGEILDALERRLAPRHLLERGVDMLKDTMSGNSGKIGDAIGDTVRNNPIPLALIGVGLGWMLMSSTSGGRVGEYSGALRERLSGTVRDMGERAGEIAGRVKDTVTSAASSVTSSTPYSTEASGHAYARQKPGEAVSSTAHDATNKASGMIDEATRRAQDTASAAASMARDTAQRVQEAGATAVQRAGDYAQYAGDQLGVARDRFTSLVEEHPLAVGALGFVAGAVVAFMLPVTRVEDRWVAPASGQLRDQAEALGRQAVERAQQVAERTVDAAVDAVKDVVHETTEAVSGKSGEARSETNRSGTGGTI